MFDKRFILILFLLLFGRIYAKSTDSIPELTFDVDTADFGIVVEGDSVVYDFWFTNTGKANLIINQAYPACGCTHPTHTKGIIPPGERGKVHVVFLSKNFGFDSLKNGNHLMKEVIIINNGAERYARFKVVVLTKKQYELNNKNQMNLNLEVKKKKSKKRSRK